MRLPRLPMLLLSLGMLLGCFPRGDPSKPIPTVLVEAPRKAQRLVVVLPGRADDLDDLRTSGIAQAVQAAWPDADVILAGLTLGYYFQGEPEQRLHQEIILPALRRNYAQIWLVGASLGGMGAIQYDRAYPNQVTGTVLLAPYLGEKPVLAQIAAAGGLALWQPPPRPAAVTQDNFEPELWRYLQTWQRNPSAARNVWLAYGDTDRLRNAVPLLAPALPAGHVLERKGGHDWSVWSPATREVLMRVEEEGVAGR